MILSIIVAMDEKNGIARQGKLPWHLSKDLKRFKALTMDHTVIMGRKTFESIGRELPGRTNLVITRQEHYQVPGCLVVHSLQEGLSVAEEKGEKEAFIIGGGEIYAQAYPLADRIYLTVVYADTEADIFFPNIDLSAWNEVFNQEDPGGVKDEYPTIFKILERKDMGISPNE